jgi:multicomponent K+:H+ antiporter subunit E
MKSRWFAHPVLSVVLALVWLVLQQSLGLANLVTAAVLGLVVPRLLDPLLDVRVHVRSLGVALRFVGVVLWDIVVSNVVVARIVLSPRARPQPAWVVVPIELKHPVAQVLLATVITATPGTLSCVLDEERGEILVHALDCTDPAELARQIKSRYEAPLKAIFE